MAQVLGGNTEAFGLLIDRHGSAAMAVARGLVIVSADADDVVQEAFVKAFQKLDTLQQPHRFGAWLLTIVRNSAIRLRERRLREVPLEQIEEPQNDGSGRDADLERIIRGGLAGLEAKQREILALHYFAGKSIQECAALQDISRAAAAKRLQRARQALGTELIHALGPEAREAFALDARKRKAILGAVLAAGASWQAQAAAGSAIAGAAGTGWILKLALGGALVAGAVVVAGLSAPAFFDGQDDTAVAEADSADVPVADAATGADFAESEDATVSIVPERAPATGEGRIQAQLVDANGQAVTKAACTLEQVTWTATEAPPEKTLKWNGEPDAEGKVLFSNLPMGEYCLKAISTQGAAFEDYNLRPEYPESLSSTLEMLPSARDFRGVVVGPDGAPVPDAWVYPVAHELYPDTVAAHTQVASLRAGTDAEGAFTVPVVWPGRLKYFVYAPGYAPMMSDYVSHTEQARFVLAHGQDLTGTLVNADTEDGIPGVRVTLNFADRVEHTVATDAEGRFLLSDVALGDYEIALEDPALVLAKGDRVTVQPDTPLTITATVGGVVMGQVTDANTGRGIPGIQVSVYSQGPSRRITTDTGGNYIAMGLTAGLLTVQLDETPGYQNNPAMARPGETFHQLTLAPGAVLEDINFNLKPALRVEGVVVDTAGAPVEDARVYAAVAPAGEVRNYYVPRIQTEARGRFVFDTLPDGHAIAFLAQKDAAASEAARLGADDVAGAQLRLVLDQDASATVRGRVQGPGGAALRDAGLQLEDADGFTWSADFGPGGRFVVEDLPAGIYKTQTWYEFSDGYSPVCRDTPEIEVRAGEMKDNVLITCGESGPLSIRGTVYRPDGRTKAGAEVYIPSSAYRAVTDVRGHYTLSGLTEGVHRVNVSARGFAAAEAQEVDAGATQADFVLREPVTLRGRVVDAETGAGLVADLQIRAGQTTSYTSHTSDDDGHYEVTKLADWSIMIQANAPGYVTHSAWVTATSVAMERDIPMRPAATIAGTVFNPDGQPASGVKVMRGNQPFEAAAITQPDGGFQVMGLTRGQPLALIFESEAHGATQRTVVPGEAGADQLEVVLEDGPVVLFEITLNGEPAENFEVSAQGTAPGGGGFNYSSGYGDSDRHAVLRSLPAGLLEVKVSLHHAREPGEVPALQSISRSMDLRAGESYVFAHDFRVGSSTVVGRMLDAAGTPVGPGRVSIVIGDEENARVNTPDGSFELTNLPAGEFDIIGLLYSGGRVRQTITVGEDTVEEIDLIFAGTNEIVVSTPPGQVVTLYEGQLSEAQAALPPAENEAWTVGTLYTGDEGLARFPKLVDGEYWVVLLHFPDGGAAAALALERVRVSGGTPVEVNFGG